MKNNVKPIPDGYHTATPYLIVRGAAAAIDFYHRAFDAKEVCRMRGPNGKITHAEILVGNSHIMLTEESAACGTLAPAALNGTASSVFLYLEDVDRTFQQALRAGATETMPVENMFWGDRFGKLTDPFGHKWMLATHIEDVSPEEMEQRTAPVVSK